MKFAEMTCLYRAAEDKYRDAHDFIRIVKSNEAIDREKLADLASLIYPQGSQYILAMIGMARAGEMLVL